MSENCSTASTDINVEDVSIPQIPSAPDLGPGIAKRLSAAQKEKDFSVLTRAQLTWTGFGEGRQLMELQTLSTKSTKAGGVNFSAYTMSDLSAASDLAMALSYTNRFGKIEAIDHQGVYLVCNRHKEGYEARPTLWGAWTPNPGWTNGQAIESRRVFYFDLDTRRVNDQPISATSAELVATIRKASTIYSEIAFDISGIAPEIGDPESALGFMMSGNGVQIHVRLADLPATDKLDLTIRSILLCADQLWSTPQSKIDTSVGNAERICPLAGTMKRKAGDYRPSDVDKANWRPHRRVLWTSATVTARGLTEAHLDAFLLTLRGRMSPEQLKAADDELAGKKKDAPRDVACRSSSRATFSGPHPYEVAGNIPTIDVMTALGLMEGGTPKCPVCGKADTGKVNEHVFHCFHATCGSVSLNNIGLVSVTIFGKSEIKSDSTEGKANAREAYLWLKAAFPQLPELGEGRKARLEARRSEVIRLLADDPKYLDGKVTALLETSPDEEIRALLEDIEVAPAAAGGAAKKKLKTKLALTEAKIRELTKDPEKDEDKGESSYKVIEGKIHSGDIALCNFSAEIVSCTIKDNGVEQTKMLSIKGTLADGRPLATIDVPVEDYEGMSWVVTGWDTLAKIEEGRGTKDALRAAIQTLSSTTIKTVYAHTGWRTIGGKHVYLHGGGGIGADGVQVQFGSARLANYTFPVLGDEEQLREAVRRSLSILDVAPMTVTAPLLSAAYLAPLRSTVMFRCPIVVIGRTKSLKSTLAVQALAHFGRFQTDQDLPVDFRSTYASIESLLFATKDALSVVDDYYPRRSTKEAEAQKTLADQIVRAVGNGHGRDRMTKDLQERASRPPRGVVVITAEEDPYPPSEGESASSRAIKVTLQRGDVDLRLLTEIQRRGNHALAMRSYVERLGRDYASTEARIRARHEALVDELRQRPDLDTRQPEDLAALLVAAEEMLAHAVDVSAISQDESDARMMAIRTAILGVATEQTTITRETSTEARFLDLVRSALTSGKGRLVLRSRPLTNALGCPDIGWVDQDEGRVYLHPTSTYVLAADMAKGAGDGPLMRLPTIYAQLVQRGWAAPPSEKAKVGAKVSALGGSRERVISMPIEQFEGVPLPTQDAEDAAEDVPPQPRPANVIDLFPQRWDKAMTADGDSIRAEHLEVDPSSVRRAANDDLIEEV